MAGLALGVVDEAGEVDRLEDLAVGGEVELAGQMRGGDEDGRVAGQLERADGDAMALDARRKEAGMKAGEEDDVAAVAAGEMVVGALGVELPEDLRPGHGALGEDEDVDTLVKREAGEGTGEAAAV